jgi:hypothetical protein
MNSQCCESNESHESLGSFNNITISPCSFEFSFNDSNKSQTSFHSVESSKFQEVQTQEYSDSIYSRSIHSAKSSSNLLNSQQSPLIFSPLPSKSRTLSSLGKSGKERIVSFLSDNSGFCSENNNCLFSFSFSQDNNNNDYNSFMDEKFLSFSENKSLPLVNESNDSSCFNENIVENNKYNENKKNKETNNNNKNISIISNSSFSSENTSNSAERNKIDYFYYHTKGKTRKPRRKIGIKKKKKKQKKRTSNSNIDQTIACSVSPFFNSLNLSSFYIPSYSSNCNYNNLDSINSISHSNHTNSNNNILQFSNIFNVFPTTASKFNPNLIFPYSTSNINNTSKNKNNINYMLNNRNDDIQDNVNINSTLPVLLCGCRECCKTISNKGRQSYCCHYCQVYSLN